MNMQTSKHALAASAAPLALETKDAGGHTQATDTPLSAEVKTLLEDLQRTNAEFQAKVTQELTEAKKGGVDAVTADEVKKINDALDGLRDQIKQQRLADARPEIVGPDGSKRQATDAEVKHRKAVMDYLRKGNTEGFDEAEVKALSVGSDPDGGYVVDSVLDAEISRVVSEISPMRQLASVTALGTAPTYKKLVNIAGAQAGWVGETSARPQTDTSKLQERKFDPGEMYALPYITQTMLDDGAIDLEAWLSEEVRIVFAEHESDAFINGDGVDKPRGIVGGYEPIANGNFSEAAKRPGYVITGANGGFSTGGTGDSEGEDALLDLVYSMKRAYRSNANWLMNRLTIGTIRKLRDADGRALWQEMTASGEPAQLLGFPVQEDDEMPDIAADSFSIAFGDFRAAYRIVDKGGTRVLRDPYTAKPFVQLYTTRRVGGGVQMFEAYKLLKFGTS